MHYIQKHILDELRTVESLRYAQLNADGVESGHFRYHLGQLVNDEYVEQLERGLYGLTTKGQQYVDKLSERGVNPSPMPKVITYTLLKDGNNVLLQEKRKQPYMGLLNMVGGKLHHGELAHAAAVREVREKTGNKIEKPNLAGVFEIVTRKEGGILSHVIAYVFMAHVNSKDYTSESIKIISTDELHVATNLAPDFLPIFDAITDDPTTRIEALEI